MDIGRSTFIAECMLYTQTSTCSSKTPSLKLSHLHASKQCLMTTANQSTAMNKVVATGQYGLGKNDQN